MERNKKLIVIGGGAAGFFCAINAARLHKDLKVVLLEKTNKLLSKVRISGGGRCNVTHACFDINTMAECYPRGKNFVKKTFHQFFTQDTIDWFEKRGVKLKTENDGRMFPHTNNSETIIECLLYESEKYQVQILKQAEVINISKQENTFSVQIKNQKNIFADYVCVACGGINKSIHVSWLKSIGHQITSPVPSLFTFNIPNHPIRNLQGLSVKNAQIKLIGSKLKSAGAILITHWGLSGPAILKLSAFAAIELAQKNWHFDIVVNWIPAFNENELILKLTNIKDKHPQQKIVNNNELCLPSRLWQLILNEAEVSYEYRWHEIHLKSINRIVNKLQAFQLSVSGKTTFKDEFVTAGGVSLSEVSPKTMMSNKISNLYFAGEILDIDGITGGYNFQNAWTTAWIAAKSIGS